MKKKRKSTMVEMVDELERLHPLFLATGKGADDVLNYLIAEAKAGEYHDFKNQKYDCGKVAIVGHLENLAKQCTERGFNDLALGLRQISSDVKGGEYDEEADEQDKELLKQILNENGMGGDNFKRLFGL